MAAIPDGDFAEAVRWADATARTPRAHAVIEMVAVGSHGLAGETDAARKWTTSVRQRLPNATRGLFFDALPIRLIDTRGRTDGALADFGFAER